MSGARPYYAWGRYVSWLSGIIGVPGKRWLLLGLVATVIAAGTGAQSAHAAITFELRTGNNTTGSQSMIADSNQCPTKGPTAMYVGGVVTNTGGSRVSGITATIGGLNGNVYLAGGQPAAQDLGALDAGESIPVFWLTGYGCTEFASASPTVSITSSTTTAIRPLVLSIRKAISANAGGQVLSATLGPGAVVGQSVYFDATYDFGGTSSGDKYFLQPAGGQNFNAACFRLAGSQILSSNVNAAPIGTIDQLYFVQPNAQPGNNYSIAVRYKFQYLCANASTVARPYAVQTSGNTNIKYTGNFDGNGSVTVAYPGATNPFTITKSVSSAAGFVGSTGPLTYTVTIANPSSQPSFISRIGDTLPAGVTYLALSADSDVTAANSSSVPAAAATGALTFQGKLGQSYAIAPGGSVVLKYTASRPATAGTYTNSAQAYFGSATTPVAQATYQQVTVVPLTATKVSYIYSDPANGPANPKAIPGAVVDYTMQIGNPNSLAIDANSVIVSDKTASSLKLCVVDIGAVGTGPVVFRDGSPSFGLTHTFYGLARTDDTLELSSDNGSTWGYVPSADVSGCDSAVTHFRVRPTGSFAAGSSFSIEARYQIK